MKTISVANQPWLSLRRTIAITMDGIRYRLFRATVTVAVIALAVAFMMNILAESLMKRRIAVECRDRIAASHLIYDWSSRLSSPGSRESLLREVAQAELGDATYGESQAFGGLSSEAMAEYQALARRTVAVMDFFQGLDYAKRRTLVHAAEGLGVLEHLRSSTAMEEFRTALSGLKSVRFEMTQEEQQGLLDQLDGIKATSDQILDGRRRAIAALQPHLEGRLLLMALAEVDGAFGDVVRRIGFRLDAEKVAPLVAIQARRQLDIQLAEKLLDLRLITPDEDSEISIKSTQVIVFPFRQLLARHTNHLPADITPMILWEALLKRRCVNEFHQKITDVRKQLAENPKLMLEGVKLGDLDASRLSVERLRELAAFQEESSNLAKAARLTADAEEGVMGIGVRLGWLLLISLMVCVIGITNAMMMSVTERFTEIATLKCLGALDGFIMLMFVLESCMMGVAGGIAGALLGGVIGMMRMVFAFGLAFVPSIPFGDMGLGMLCSVLMGTLLAAIAAIIPSYKAARLAPMEAMRVE